MCHLLTSQSRPSVVVESSGTYASWGKETVFYRLALVACRRLMDATRWHELLFDQSIRMMRLAMTAGITVATIDLVLGEATTETRKNVLKLLHLLTVGPFLTVSPLYLFIPHERGISTRSSKRMHSIAAYPLQACTSDS